MIVRPVPWLLAESLKFETSTSPATRLPTLRGTTATPYGFTSPLPGLPVPSEGTVEAIFVIVWKLERNGGAV